MVTFSCDSCADTVKKQKVPQHIFRCPEASFTCIDCSTTFQGDSYIPHTSCISEAEKYQKSLYKGNKKDQTLNKRKQPKFDTPNNNNKQFLESKEQNKKILGQDHVPDNNINHIEQNSKRKKKNKNKKNQQQGNQPNENKVSDIKGEKTDDNNNNKVPETPDATVNNNISKKKRKKDKKLSVDNKIGGSKDNENCIDSKKSQHIQTYEANKVPKKEINIESLNENSSKKKNKKKRKNDYNDLTNSTDRIDHKQNNGTEKDSESLIGILKKDPSDGKNKKRKVEFTLPGSPTNNKRKNEENNSNVKKSKISHENGKDTYDLSNYYESIPATVKKIFKSKNANEEFNLKHLEEMVVCELISSSNLSSSELKEKFLENIVLTMKDGDIILK